MALVAWFIILPLVFASLLVGIVQSLGTPWGLFRHWWVLLKLLLTVFAIIVLLLQLDAIGYVADAATATTFPGADLWNARLSLAVHAAGGLLVLLVPWCCRYTSREA